MTIWLLLALAYLLGSIPFGVLIAKAKGVDIQSVGSGNIGATNVRRALGLKAGLLVFALDMLKGLLPTVAARYAGVGPDYVILVGLGAVAGHMFSVFLKFKGGKGVATSMGVLTGAAPLIAAIAFGAFLVFVTFTRYISLSSLVACFVAIVCVAVFRPGIVTSVIVVALSLLIVVKHIPNMKRLLAGTEPKFELSSEKNVKEQASA